MHLPRWALVACAAATTFVVTSTATAATRTVYMGTPPSAAQALQRLSVDANAFFPHTTTIRQGDSVRFVPVGFHNVDLPERGGDPTPLISPTGDEVAGAVDAAGAPFWFNGQDILGFTPSLGESNFGKRLSYNGSESVNSGLPLADRPRPMTVRFPRRGTYTFLCDVHPGMRGRVRVVGRDADAPSARQHTRRIARQIAKARRDARELADAEPPENTVNVGVAGPGGLEYLGFAPAEVRVTPGTTLTFRMAPGTYDLHTATTGPGNPESEPGSYLGELAATFQSPVFDPRSVYGSEPPGTVASITPTLHGNGFWNSGVMDPVRASPPPRSSRVRFDTPGTYTFFCLIHPFMRATVEVG